MRAKRELILLGASDAVLAAQVLRSFQHPARHRVARAAGGDARARETVLQSRAVAAHAPAHACGVELRLAHALGAPR